MRDGYEALAIPSDVGDEASTHGMAKQTIAKYGRIDILVNNAGTNPIWGSVFNVEEAGWDVVIGLNLKSYFFLSQAVGKIMRNQGGGTIINTASIAGFRASVGQGVYSISKAGVVMLTQVLAQECGQYNIRVNAIAPGLVRTRLAEGLWKDPIRVKMMEDESALGRIAEPEEMACAVLFLASDLSAYITGQVIRVDGGIG